MNITKLCPFCGKESTVKIDSKEYNKMLKAGINATSLPVREREFLITGMCFDCMEKTFNHPTPEHEAEWGELKTECEVCGCSIYEKDYVEEDVYQCPCCKFRSDEEWEECEDE